VGAEQTTVLVADDEPSIRLLCRVNLEFEGWRVLEAATLDEARAELEREHVDVLLIDVHLGDRDGRDLVRELRAQDKPLPIALLTGSVSLNAEERGGADDARQCRRSGASGACWTEHFLPSFLPGSLSRASHPGNFPGNAIPLVFRKSRLPKAIFRIDRAIVVRLD
jgi:CheY-like chemotaxis protein